MPKVRVTLVKSPTGYPEDQKKTVRSLGLNKMGKTVEHDFSRSVRGMIIKVQHLVKYDVREDQPAEQK
jgi:large subunit ribosomal protein L30